MIGLLGAILGSHSQKTELFFSSAVTICMLHVQTELAMGSSFDDFLDAIASLEDGYEDGK